jgi:tetratricopeptide (TPR) repeat protein
VLEARAQYEARQVDAAEQTFVRASEQCALFRDGALYELVALRREQRRADAASVAVLADVLARNCDDWRVVGLHALLTDDVAELRRAGSLAPPDDYRPHFWLGEALLGGADGARAGEALLRAAERNPHNALIFEALGRYYRDVARDRARAQRCFAQATRLDSSLRDAADALAALLVAGGALPLAADVYAEAARQHPSLLWPWEQHAHHLRRCVREIDARDPATVDEADRQRAVRWASDALTSLQNALRVDEKRAVLWQALATTYSRLGKFAAAMKAARRAFELDGSSTMPQILLAQLLLDVGDVRGAAAAFGDAGDSVPARIGAADSLLRWSVALDKAASVGRAAQARKAARRALERVAAGGAASTIRALQLDGDVALLDAVAVRDAGARKAAMAHAVAQRVALVRKNATNPWSYVLLGHALLLAASLDTAAGSEVNATRAQRSREAFLRALRLASSTDKPDASLAPLLGALWVSLGVSCAESPLIAQHCFVHALRMDERSVVAWTNLGHLLASRQRLGLAADALERACVLKPSFAPAWVASGTVRELLASRLVGRRRMSEARAEWRVALHAYARAVEMAASDALTGALGDASPSASSVTSASGARAALRAARIGIASCTVALVRSGDKSVDVDRALLAVQQVSLEDAAPDVDVLSLLGVCSALRGQFEAAADAFRLALDLCAGADSTKGAADFDLQRSLLPSISAVSTQQRRAVLISNAVAAALRAGQPTAALAPLAHEKDLIAAALALDVKTACRVALALARCVGRAKDALALAKRLSERIVERSVHTLGEPATSATLAKALIALSAVCTVAGDAKASRECVSLCCELFPDTPAAWRRLAMQAALDGDLDTVLFVLGNADYVNTATREGAERTVREVQLLDVLGERRKARALIVRGVHERPDAGALWQELWIDGTHEADGSYDAVRSDVDLGLACRAGLSHSARASWWTDDELSSALLRLGTTEGLAADAVHGSAVLILEKRLRDCGSWALLPGSTLLLLVAALRAHAVLQPTDVARWQKLAAMLASWRATKRSTGSVSGDLRLRLYAIECQLYDGTPASALDVAECVGVESSGLLPAAAVASVRARVECAIAQRSNGSIADVLRAAIRRQPALAELWLMLGEHYAAVGQAGAAVACAETALALPKLTDREKLVVQLRLAHFQLGARAYERAAEAAGAVAKQSPRCAVAHLLRAVALLKAGADASEIFAALQACLLLDSEQPHARFLLAFVLLQLGDLARAEAHAVRLLEAQPDMPRAAHMFARILTAQASGKDVDGAKKAKLLKRAEALLRRAIAGDANVADFAKDLAKVEKQLKENK